MCLYSLVIRIYDALDASQRSDFLSAASAPQNRWVKVQIIDLDGHVRVVRFGNFIELASVDILNGDITSCPVK